MMKRLGVNVVKAEVDIDQFVAWSQSRGLAIDGKARTRYAKEIAAAHFKANQKKH
jgi:hypothetical protein